MAGVDPGYEVSDRGRVRSVDRVYRMSDGRVAHYRGKPRKLIRRKDGYLQVRLKDASGKTRNFLVHRLVALAFVPNPDNLPEVNHRDNDPENNRATNLEWLSTQDNTRHAHSNGHVNSARGEDHGRSKLSEKWVRLIRKWAAPLKVRGRFAVVRRKLERRGVWVTNEAVAAVVYGRTWTHVV